MTRSRSPNLSALVLLCGAPWVVLGVPLEARGLPVAAREGAEAQAAAGDQGAVGAQEAVQLAADDRPIELELEELYAVGGMDAEPWAEFQAVNDAAFGPDGRLYLLDAPGEKIVAVSPNGGLLYRVGRPGEGPGEHDNASGLAALPDGRVAVWDFGRRAFLLFDTGARYVGEVRPDFTAGLPNDPFVPTPDGSLLAFPFQITMSGAGLSYLSAGGVKAAEDGLPLLRIPLADGEPVEVFTHARLLRWPSDGDPPIHRAFQPRPSWGPLADGRVALHQSEAYRIEVLAPDGSIERVLTRPLESRPTTGRDERAYAEDLRRRFENGDVIVMGGGGGAGTMRAQIREQLDETGYYPRITPILEITADGGERVWVRRRHPDDPNRPGPVDVLSVDGRYLGTLPAEGPGLPLAFGPGGLVAFVETDALDVPTVRVYRVSAGSR